MKLSTMSRREMLTETPIPELIIKLSIPTILSMMVTAFYNSADTYFVGRISTEATAAVGLVFSVMAIIQAFGFMCGHGSGNYLSRMLGADNKKEANEMASTGFAISLILGIIVALLGNIFINRIAVWIGADADSMELTVSYMRIILLGAPFMMGQFVINNQLRFQGSAVYAMIGLMCGAVINVILDPLLILYFGMGVRGAAIATVMGQITSFIVLLIGSSKGENIHLSIKNVHINWHYIVEVINGGAPSLLRQGMAALSTLLLNNYAGKLGGSPAIAGMSIVTRVMMMMLAALIGFGQGFQPVCSFNYGAGLRSRVKEAYFFCVRWGFIFLLAIGAVCFIFAPDIVWWFRGDPAVVEVGAVALRFQASVIALSAPTIMTNMMLQSMGKGVKASILSSARNGLFFIPLIIILPIFFGLFGVQITQTCSDILTVFLTIPFAISELKNLK
ncbi:putative efflux protein, MATE family [Lachnospiraceae bacterium NE2001]|nr:putative efflux protein, MATE family [Lachnospiraceae bacterium NE2001]